MNTQFDTNAWMEEDTALAVDHDQHSHIVVYNDDHNTFDWVIQCFMEVLNHTERQSEQLSILIHYKGKASVKQASFDELRPLKDALVERGLSAVIEHLVD